MASLREALVYGDSWPVRAADSVRCSGVERCWVWEGRTWHDWSGILRQWECDVWAVVQEEGDEPKAFASVNWVLSEDELDLETQVLAPLPACMYLP